MVTNRTKHRKVMEGSPGNDPEIIYIQYIYIWWIVHIMSMFICCKLMQGINWDPSYPSYIWQSNSHRCPLCHWLISRVVIPIEQPIDDVWYITVPSIFPQRTWLTDMDSHLITPCSPFFWSWLRLWQVWWFKVTTCAFASNPSTDHRRLGPESVQESTPDGTLTMVGAGGKEFREPGSQPKMNDGSYDGSCFLDDSSPLCMTFLRLRDVWFGYLGWDETISADSRHFQTNVVKTIIYHPQYHYKWVV